MQISPPLYLATSATECWRCKEIFPVAGLIVITHDDPDNQGLAGLLTYIKTLPSDLVDFAKSRCESFRLKDSQTVGFPYFGNVCPYCHTLSGDDYLHSPGGALAPVHKEQAQTLTLEEVPLTAEFEIDAEANFGNVEMLLDHGERANP